MLPDLERKILRIMYNYTRLRDRMPTLNELEIKTGQRKQRIQEALLLLEKENYILWQEKPSLEQIVIIEGWERKSGIPKPVLAQSTLDYWTQY